MEVALTIVHLCILCNDLTNLVLLGGDIQNLYLFMTEMLVQNAKYTVNGSKLVSISTNNTGEGMEKQSS